MLQTFTVYELTKRIKLAIEGDPLLQAVLVRGEISNFRRHSSGHVWFSLKDEAATIRCVMFKSRASRLEFSPCDGMSVLVFGSVSVYEKEGQYQLYVETMVPEGEGAIKLELERLKSKLAAEGLFNPERKRPLPLFPRKIGVVTSMDGAAVKDIIAVARRRFPGCELVVAGVLVQGENAPATICEGLALVNEVEGVDVVIIGRGGGSAEELWAFNDERVVRAVYSSRAPVVSAVGHERDVTLVDLVADVRAPTPSAAAELVVPDKQALVMRVQKDVAALGRAVESALARRKSYLELMQRVLALRGPEMRIAETAKRVEQCAARIQGAVQAFLRSQRHRVELAAKALEGCNPQHALRMGYAIVRSPDGSVLTTVRRVYPGMNVGVQLFDGRFDAQVGQVSEV
ncbi:MAG: exodeoxyribonuclease VII large subunit [Bacillota bacterium]